MDNEKEIDYSKIRSKYFTYMLYPDNAYHMEYLSYLEKTADGFYIIHKQGDELVNIPLTGILTERKNSKGKAHIHVFQIFKNARKVSGVLDSFPVMKYYEVLSTYEIKQKLFLTVYDLPYITLPVQEVYKPLVEVVKPIIDPYAYATYLLHKDYKSYSAGKRVYDIKDIKMLKSDRTLLNRFFDDYKLTDEQMVDLIMQIYACSDGDKNLFLQLCCMHSSEVIKYVQSHAYFIKTFIFEKGENVNDGISFNRNTFG